MDLGMPKGGGIYAKEGRRIRPRADLFVRGGALEGFADLAELNRVEMGQSAGGIAHND